MRNLWRSQDSTQILNFAFIFFISLFFPPVFLWMIPKPKFVFWSRIRWTFKIFEFKEISNFLRYFLKSLTALCLSPTIIKVVALNKALQNCIHINQSELCSWGEILSQNYSVTHISIHPSKELCSKTASGEVGVWLSWWCPTLPLPAPDTWGQSLNLIIFS